MGKEGKRGSLSPDIDFDQSSKDDGPPELFSEEEYRFKNYHRFQELILTLPKSSVKYDHAIF